MRRYGIAIMLLFLVGSFLNARLFRSESTVHAHARTTPPAVNSQAMNNENPSFNIAYLAGVGGTIYSVAAHGDYAFLRTEDHILVIDSADRANPQVIGSLLLPGASYLDRIMFDAGYLYLHEFSANTLRIIDVQQPDTPKQVSVWRPDAADLWDIAIADGFVYVTTTGGIHVLDVSDPLAPTEVNRYKTSFGVVRTIAGQYAFATHAQSSGGFESLGSLEVLSLSDPGSLTPVGSITVTTAITRDNVGISHTPLDITVAGNYAYVAVGSVGVQIVDISEPQSPVRVGLFSDLRPSDTVQKVVVQDNYAYISSTFGVYVVDITDPANPQRVRFFFFGVLDVSLNSNMLYVANGDLHILSLADPVALPEVGLIRGRWEVVDIIVTEEIAFVAARSMLHTFDVSNPSQPQETATLSLSGEVRDLSLSGNYLYIANNGLGVQVVDISNPQSPALVGSLPTPANLTRVAVAGTYAYVIDGDMHIIDIANPTAPVVVGVYDSPADTLDITVHNRHAYVATNGAGIRIVDLADPMQPKDVGELADFSNNLEVFDGYLYYTINAGGQIVKVDITNPAAPQAIGSLDTGGSFTPGFKVVDNYIYACIIHTDPGYIRPGPVNVFDTTSFVSPILVGAYESLNWCTAMDVQDGYIYYLTESGGSFSVLQFTRLNPFFLPIINQ